MLSDAEIVRRLSIIRHSSRAARYGGYLPSISGVASRAGITQQAIYQILKTGSLGVSAARLSAALESYQHGYRVRSSVAHDKTASRG